LVLDKTFVSAKDKSDPLFNALL